MNPRFWQLGLKLTAAVACGILLRCVLSLHPVWWLVWLAPAPLLVIAIRMRPRDARWMIALAALIGASCYFHYFRLLMPLPSAILSVALLALFWSFLIVAPGRVMSRYRSWWTVFAYPALLAALDTLLAAWLPDGNWGSLAYSQGDRVVIFQILSLFGTPGLLFLIGLVPSTLAFAVACGKSARRGWLAYGITALLLISSLAYGARRLRNPVRGTEVTFGLVSIDNTIGIEATRTHAEPILIQYARRIGEAAALGAQIVILPEAVETIPPAKIDQEQQRWSEAARRSRVWLEVGVGIDDGRHPTSRAWLFAPDGALAANYEKHFLAPPERRSHYAAGHAFSVTEIYSQPYGLAICKDMHFAVLGRDYGRRRAAAMLIPAADFAHLDGWLEARTTIARGVENGYTIARASREGLLTVSDPYGRILAEARSRAMPGQILVAKTLVSAPISTLYIRIGSAFGWLCVLASAVFLVIGRQRSSAPACIAASESKPLLTAR